jgi:hypothetical protein
MAASQQFRNFNCCVARVSQNGPTSKLASHSHSHSLTHTTLTLTLKPNRLWSVGMVLFRKTNNHILSFGEDQQQAISTESIIQIEIIL